RQVLHGRFERVLVCSVAGVELERALRRAARASGNPQPQFIRSTRRSAGVRNGYVQTWRLGADRWVAMLGARALHPRRALCVVDVGTALTLDLLDTKGQHRGGLLTPGPALMVESLLSHTAGIRRRAALHSAQKSARRKSAALFGRSTRAGLLAGSSVACAALIERALGEARTVLRGRPKLLLAGGGAPQVAPLLRVPYTRVDHLVLHGLALLASFNSR
ncbi:MAG TPA: type III pantothenate kinase, partial [Steroidobacteraceae bacterium]|nr:type III pantothenate kinase [Steroidobacteraceae bacterium]